MGKPAARVGDLTSHGSPLSPGPGSPDVFIGGKPAWRVTDIHSCPLTSPNPHGSCRKDGGYYTGSWTSKYYSNR